MLAAEALIAERLAGIDGVAGVHPVASLDPDGLGGKRLPALFVAHDGYTPAETTGQRQAVRVRLFFLVIAAVAEHRVLPQAASARPQAGDLAEAVIRRLVGWQPAPGWWPLALVAGPAPAAQPGLLLYPLRFASERLIETECAA